PEGGPGLPGPRVGLPPPRPPWLGGLRRAPRPAPACAPATMPLATAAAEPPGEPPVEWPVCHGLRAGGKLSGSVVTVVPSSGTLVRPSGMKPAARSCPARYEVTGQATSSSGPSPKAVTSPATKQPRSLSRIGTPRTAPPASGPAACARAWSNRVRIPASSRGFSASIRAIAASTSSAGLASPRRTRPAWAVASSQVVSGTEGTVPSRLGPWIRGGRYSDGTRGGPDELTAARARREGHAGPARRQVRRSPGRPARGDRGIPWPGSGNGGALLYQPGHPDQVPGTHQALPERAARTRGLPGRRYQQLRERRWRHDLARPARSRPRRRGSAE